MSTLLLLSHLLLATFASALPTGDVTTTTAGNSWQYGTGGGILGLIVLVLDIIVFGTRHPPSQSKERKGKKLTQQNSRGDQVNPPAAAQAPLVAARLLLPYRRAHHLLPVFEPGVVYEWRGV